MISLSDYGSYVVNFLENTFDCSFSTLTATCSSKVETFHIRFIYIKISRLMSKFNVLIDQLPIFFISQVKTEIMKATEN